jgi:hypothetical protein
VNPPGVVVPPVTLPDAVGLPELPELPATPDSPVHGAILFARYAYPPNELGYCGPPDNRALFEYGATQTVDRGLLQIAQGFNGAWPYLEFISRATGVESPLDRRVVEGYWLGGPLLDRIDMKTFGNALFDRFRKSTGTKGWGFLAEAIPEGAVPDHNFHVFGVYPWVGLLKTGRASTPLEHLDKCRIRWGQVVSVEGDQVTVLSRPLTYDGKDLGLGERRLETVRASVDGVAFLDAFRPGEWVSMHWNWVCDRLSRRQLHLLRRSLQRQLDITNHRVAHPGPRAVIG